jgi:hypothetical protein
MHRSLACRLAAVVIAVGVTVPAYVLASTSVAAAASQVTCTKLSGTAQNQKLSDCSGGPPGLFGSEAAGKGTAKSTPNDSPPPGYQQAINTQWGPKGNGLTTMTGINVTTERGGPCGPGKVTITETGVVYEGNGVASELVSDTLSATICRGAYKTEKLLKHTTYDT